MPGKKGRYGTVGIEDNPAIKIQPALGINDPKGKAARLKSLFGSGPTCEYKENGNNIGSPTAEYSDELMRELAAATMFADNVNGDPNIWPQGVDTTFSKTPDIPKDVQQFVGGGGKPGTPYSPNPASPGANADGSINVDPSTIPDISAQLEADNKDHVPGVNGLVNPKTSSESIVTSAKTGNYVAGSHSDTSTIKTM